MIGPYFCENEDGTTVTVNSKRYGHTTTGFFLPAIKEGATWRICGFKKTVPYATQLEQEAFSRLVISHRADISWLPLDFLWG